MRNTLVKCLALVILAVGALAGTLLHFNNVNFGNMVSAKFITSGVDAERRPMEVKSNVTKSVLSSLPNASVSEDTPHCVVIHVCIVCAGYNAARDATTVIKSLLRYRTNTLHFHFIVDSASRPILKTLFETWAIPSVLYSFYSTSLILDDVSWVPNSHYSGVFGLMKLQMPYVLPPSVDKVILLDTDVVFTADITELWNNFSAFHSTQYLGLVENLSFWYKTRNSKTWPALGRGFNTGVMLMNLQRMRDTNWKKLWKQTTKKYLPSRKTVKLADQDVINAVIKDSDGSVVYNLSCSWNVQITVKTTFKEACYSVGAAKVLHFNSKNKLKISYKSQHAKSVSDLFKKAYYTSAEYDGNLLRNKPLLSGCGKRETNVAVSHTAIKKLMDSKPNVFSACHQVEGLRESSHGRVHLFYLAYNYMTQPGDITLVAQLNFDDLKDLELLCTKWNGPMSLALYLSEKQARQLYDYVSVSPIISKRKNIGFHVVYQTGIYYPVNYLMNVALSQASTEYVFLTNVDSVPATNMFRYVKDLVQQQNIHDKKIAFVVAAFVVQGNISKIPSDKNELKKSIDSGQIKISRNGALPSSDNRTNWFQSVKPYQISWEPNYQPCIVMSRAMVPKYDERFTSLGWNTISHIIEVDAQGFKLMMVPDVFVVRSLQPHKTTEPQHTTNSSSKQCLDVLKEDFIKGLSKRYGESTLKYLTGS